MVNPGAFQGSQKAFLLSQKDTYKAGVVGGYAADALAEIQHKYLKRYPIDRPHSEEPPAAWLATVDDKAPDEEQVEPNLDVLNDEELAAAIERLEERRILLCFRKAVRQHCCRHLFNLKVDVSKSNGGWHINM